MDCTPGICPSNKITPGNVTQRWIVYQEFVLVIIKVISPEIEASDYLLRNGEHTSEVASVSNMLSGNTRKSRDKIF